MCVLERPRCFLHRNDETEVLLERLTLFFLLRKTPLFSNRLDKRCPERFGCLAGVLAMKDEVQRRTPSFTVLDSILGRCCFLGGRDARLFSLCFLRRFPDCLRFFLDRELLLDLGCDLKSCTNDCPGNKIGRILFHQTCCPISSTLRGNAVR